MGLYSLFAVILDYPERPIAEYVSDCMEELAPEFGEAEAHLRKFQVALEGSSLGQLQEVYTSAFDLRPDCTPNLGYHLFGDDGRRGLFLAELKGRMAARGIPPGAELPDHLTLVLRYLDASEEEERLVMIEDCLLPAAGRIVEVFGRSENPYGHAMRALLSLIRQQHEASGAFAAEEESPVAPEPVSAFQILE